MGDAINVLLFLDLYLLSSSEAALLVRRWDAILGGDALTSFADTSLLLTSCFSAASQIVNGSIRCLVTSIH